MLTRTLQRRTFGLTLVSLGAITTASVVYWVALQLGHSSLLTGWILVISMLLLASLGIRRRLVMLPLAPVGTWVQIHLYLGLFTVLVYALHVPMLIGRGGLEFTLSLLVLGVSGSGLYGLYITRVAPRRLSSIGQEVRYDKIPWTRARIFERAEHLVGTLGETADRSVLEHYYTSRLASFFRYPPSTLYMIVPSGQRRRHLLQGLTELYRYLSPELRSVAGELAALIRQRDDVDYHYAIQFRLRTWRAIHALLTVWLLVLMSAHVVLALRMLGD